MYPLIALHSVLDNVLNIDKAMDIMHVESHTVLLSLRYALPSPNHIETFKQPLQLKHEKADSWLQYILWKLSFDQSTLDHVAMQYLPMQSTVL